MGSAAGPGCAEADRLLVCNQVRPLQGGKGRPGAGQRPPRQAGGSGCRRPHRPAGRRPAR
eukprot:1227015-Alexandrium_andersonii.AAC.1